MEDGVHLRIVTAGTETIDLSALRALAAVLTQEKIAWWTQGAVTEFRGKGDPVLGTILLKAADVALRKTIDVAAALFTRHGAPPVEIEIQTKGGRARVKFDPRRLDPARVSELVEAVARSLQHG